MVCVPTPWGGRAFKRGGGGQYSPLARPPPQKKGSIDGPQNPTETDHQAPEVARTRKWAKNENGIFGISASRGFRKVIICHVFGWGGKIVVKKNCWCLRRQTSYSLINGPVN